VKAAKLRDLSLGLLLPVLQACVAGSPEGGQASREPVRWILVERRYGDIASPGASPSDGQVNQDAVVLAFQPLYPEDLTWEVVVSPEEHFVELVGLTPARPSSPGEIVCATVRVGNAKEGQRYRLSALPTRNDVRVLGDPQLVVSAGESAVFRFTSSTSGKAGITVGVERLRSDTP
jgi:hypothetical protein